MLISITIGCHAKPKANDFDYESIVIYVLTPDITILADGNKNGLNLKKNFTYKIFSKDNFYINKYLQSIGVDEMEKCKVNEFELFPQLLIEAKVGNKKNIFLSDGKILATPNFKYCSAVTNSIVENFSFFSIF